jgi:Zn ribbon nucleic-acid-binding protein
MKCPVCKSSDGIREIVYGLPIEPLDENKYAIGGCCITEEDPTRRCIQCGWQGRYVKRKLGQGNKPEMD